VAAVAFLVSLAAVPVLADSAQEMVISRLSSETSFGIGSNTSLGKGTIQSTTPALQMRQELEQGTYRAEVIRRLASETSLKAHSKYAETDEGLQSRTAASLQVSQGLDHKQSQIRNHLHGE